MRAFIIAVVTMAVAFIIAAIVSWQKLVKRIVERAVDFIFVIVDDNNVFLVFFVYLAQGFSDNDCYAFVYN